MEHNNSKLGFVGISLLIAVAATSLLAAISTAYRVRELENERLGATTFTTQLTDTINTFRLQVNSSTANLNAELATVSTTARGVSSTIDLNFSPTIVAKGGTGTTTVPTDGQMFGAFGTTPMWKNIVGVGVTVSSTASSTVFTTQGVNLADDYAWTGLHTFTQLRSNSSTLATTTQNGPTTINGTLTSNASTTHNGTSTFRGNTYSYSSIFPSGLIESTSTDVTANANATTTIFTVTIPANILATPGHIVEFVLELTGVANSATETSTLTLTYGGTVLKRITWDDAGGVAFVPGRIYGQIVSTSGAGQETSMWFVPVGGTTAAANAQAARTFWVDDGSESEGFGTATTVSATSSQTLQLQVKLGQSVSQQHVYRNWFIRKIQ